MGKLAGLVTGLSRVLDKIAGLSMVAVMVLVVSNILMRVIFNRPILGAYEYVVFLTVITIGLSLAHCAVQNGHIAVSFVVDRLPLRVQVAVDTVMNAAALIFLGLCAWQIAVYAKKNGRQRGIVPDGPNTDPSLYLSGGFRYFCALPGAAGQDSGIFTEGIFAFTHIPITARG